MALINFKECIKRKNKLYISAKRDRISNEIYKNWKIRIIPQETI